MSEVLSPKAAGTDEISGEGVLGHPQWPVLKQAVEAIRPWQRKDGSIDFDAEGAPTARTPCARTLARAVAAVEELSPLLPHDDAYHRALVADLRRWADGGFGVPDFLDSLLAFQPATDRARRPPAPGRLRDVHPERQPRPQPRSRRAPHGVAGLAGRAGAHPLRQPAVRADHLRGLHLGLRHQLRGALPRDRRRPRGPRALHLGRDLLRPRGGPLPRGDRGRRGAPSASNCRRTPPGWSPTRSAPSRPSCSGTWSTTVPTATATCRSTRS